MSIPFLIVVKSLYLLETMFTNFSILNLNLKISYKDEIKNIIIKNKII